MLVKNLQLTFAAICMACVIGCSVNDWGNSDESVKTQSFETSAAITISFNDTYQTQYLIYFENPYNEYGDCVGVPVMAAVSPFTQQLSVPNHIDEIFVSANGQIASYKRSNFDLLAQGGSLKAKSSNAYAKDPTDTILDPSLVSYIHRVVFPEKVSIADSDTLICSDLLVGADSADVWVTFVSCGGANLNGTLGYYTYETEGTYQNYTNTGEKTSTETLFNVFGRTKASGSTDRNPTKKYIGRFAPGQKIGFVYQGGSSMLPKYSTPSRNVIPRTHGLIREINFEGKTYSVLGMENRGWADDVSLVKPDWDYNDILCLIESNPVVHPSDIVPEAPATPAFVSEFGLYLFEDNCPEKGDYDFNDLVIKYKFTYYPDDNETEIVITPLAIGAENENTLVIEGEPYSGYRGFINVGYPQLDTRLDVIRKRVSGANPSIALDNGRVSFNIKTRNPNDPLFPYVLCVPDTTFRWCLEGKRIDEAYKGYTNWVKHNCGNANNNWYKKVTDPSLLY